MNMKHFISTKSSYPAAALSRFEAVKGNRIIFFFNFLNNLFIKRKKKRKKKEKKKCILVMSYIFQFVCQTVFFLFC